MIMDKMSIRKKALDSIMKEGPSMSYKKKSMMDEGMDMEMDGEKKEMGMVQFMVSPEEKRMILEMRKKNNMGEEEVEMELDEESEY